MATLAKFLYWTGTVIAGLIVAAVLASYVHDASRGFPVASTAALLLAASIWLVGWFCSHAYAGR
jgi:hypothetical protein